MVQKEKKDAVKLQEDSAHLFALEITGTTETDVSLPTL
jgi:hypothetical protein